MEDRFGRFWRGWEEQLGKELPAPDFTPGSAGDFQMSARAVTVHDSVIADVRGESLYGSYTSASHQSDEQVVLHMVRHNSWRFARPREGDRTVPAGHFMVQRLGPPTFEEARQTSATVLIVPASSLTHLVRDRLIAGPASSAEMLLLRGHLDLVSQRAHDLSPAGALTARNATIELVKGVLRQRADSTEPHLGPALAQAAKDLADNRLTDPDLSPSTLARELNVSLRTLQRAFAAVDESIAGYIRRSRLEQARLELLAPSGRPSVSELAAQWQFADSSHFIRAFTRRYGLTPAEFARAAAGDRSARGG
ncbi:helix-turn-helix domain-containing protein [Prauserella cavernicola]|uniref:Helix-turn-helix domain-containing protein n=1 Tax=Prauserella cavernicola TaxID=2800127 RepID=A0A934QS62_9PSEU|nr:helix-turn-helix domain-containing protein [Prauserella cavernicola]MBK1787252.1 helix-turn-helix domain-containing protein [Prauserella cavernicola]